MINLIMIIMGLQLEQGENGIKEKKGNVAPSSFWSIVKQFVLLGDDTADPALTLHSTALRRRCPGRFNERYRETEGGKGHAAGEMTSCCSLVT